MLDQTADPESPMSMPITAAPADTPAWEFSPVQSVLIARLAARMRFVGAALVVLAVLLALWSVLGPRHGDMLALQLGLILGLTGLWSARAGAARARLTRTAGADIALLMRALGEMQKLYELQYWVFVALALLLAATLVMAITGAAWLPDAW